jgi:putative acetyltransferase
VLTIRRENPEDIDSIRYVHNQAFAGVVEGDIVDKLRNRSVVTLSLVAVLDGQIVGHILFSPVAVEAEDSCFEAIALGPMAVLPEYQRRGIGSRLVRAGLVECRLLSHEIVVVLGHPEYYPRFGFVQSNPTGITCAFEVPAEAWMVLELQNGALTGRSGTVRYQAEFSEAI